MRYSAQETHKRIGKVGQRKLKKKTVAVIGVGALGSVSSQLLVRAGIGRLILIDRDTVELSNIQRQTLYSEDDVSKPKALCASRKLREMNSQIKIVTHFEHIGPENIESIKADLIIDGSDNMETRFLINDYCKKKKIPWVHASAVEEAGFVFSILPDGPCFRCIFNEVSGLETCQTIGVLNTLTHIIASIQTNEALKILLGVPLEKNLIFFNVWKNELNKIKIKKKKTCPACNGDYTFLEKEEEIIKFCGFGKYLINGKFNFKKTKTRLENIGDVTDWGSSFKFKKLTVFDGKVLIEAKTKKEAKSLYSKYIGD